MTSADIKDRFEVLCNYPAAFHGTQYTAACHRILTQNEMTEADQHHITSHMCEALGQLRLTLANIHGGNVDVVVHTVLDLLFEEVAPMHIQQAPSSFVAHMPSACWIDHYGRLRAVEEHAKALQALVDLAGGVDRLAPTVYRILWTQAV